MKKNTNAIQNSRQQVTGLVVNKKVNVTAEYRHLVRAYVFSLVNRGSYKIKTKSKDDNGNEFLSEKDGTPEQLHGMLGFIHSVDSVFEPSWKTIRTIISLRTNYRERRRPTLAITKSDNISKVFALHSLLPNFYATGGLRGKTDIVYISNAVHQSKTMFPNLVKKNDSGKDILSFQFFKYDRKHKKKRTSVYAEFLNGSNTRRGKRRRSKSE